MSTSHATCASLHVQRDGKLLYRRVKYKLKISQSRKRAQRLIPQAPAGATGFRPQDGTTSGQLKATRMCHGARTLVRSRGVTQNSRDQTRSREIVVHFRRGWIFGNGVLASLLVWASLTTIAGVKRKICFAELSRADSGSCSQRTECLWLWVETISSIKKNHELINQTRRKHFLLLLLKERYGTSKA